MLEDLCEELSVDGRLGRRSPVWLPEPLSCYEKVKTFTNLMVDMSVQKM